MQDNGGSISWQKTDAGFNVSTSMSMEGSEMYFPEPLGSTTIVMVVTLLTKNELRVVFNDEPKPSRGTGKTVPCFVIGQYGNSRTTIRAGNPGVILAETKEKRALLPKETGKPVSFWFSFDANIRVAAFGLGNQPGSESTLLVVPDWCECFDRENCRLFVGLANWKEPIHVQLSQYHTSALGLNSYPDKFNDDKTVKFFPGVTCICRVNETSHGPFVIGPLVQAQEMLKATGPAAGGCFSFLPPDSFHMTLADLVTSKNRFSICPDIKGDMGQVGEELRQRSKDIMITSTSTIFYMKMENVLLHQGLTVVLRPYEEKTAAAMASWRDLMYTRLGE